ncbi:transposase [Streptomyces sp. 2132.2]|nr:transposase [Streptomyces sp. 2132.2]
MPEFWAGTDAGKAAHHCTVIDMDGTKVLSRRVPNNEPELLELIGDVLALAEDSPVTWAVDLNVGGGALLIALLTSHGQRLLYIPGRTVHHASRGYRGDGKTDAKDAYVIADQARMRRDLQPLQECDEIAVDLKILTARRYDLAADRTHAAAVAAAQAQHSAVAGESTAAAVVNTLARSVLALDEELAAIDAQIAARFRQHRDTEVTSACPAWALCWAPNSSLAPAVTWTPSAARADSPALPVSRDSSRISGNMRRPHRYHRRLLRVFYLSAQIAVRFCPTSKTFYDRKRVEGKSHKQAILALAGRCLDVLWALIRDQRQWTAQPSPAQPSPGQPSPPHRA